MIVNIEGGREPTDDIMPRLRSLIDRWCENRRLKHLAAILPGYLAVNGLTDGWFGLLAALKKAVGLGPDSLPADEWELLQRLMRDTDNALSR